MKKIKEIAGIKLHYAREPQFPYGSIGRPATFRIEEGFHDQLLLCFDEIFEHCPLGKPKVITCAGIYVNKPNSEHKKGRAFDFDAAFWSNYRFITQNFYEDYELYIGIESFLRKHFGIVLSYFYNNAHKDHYHISTAATLAFKRTQTSKVLYVQMSLRYIYKQPVEIDGTFGPQTQKYFKYVLNKLNITGSLTKQKWFLFLTKTGIISFKKFKTQNSPRRDIDVLNSRIRALNIQPDEKYQILNALENIQQEFQLMKPINDEDEELLLQSLIDEVNASIDAE